MTDYVDQTLKHWRRVPFNWKSENCYISVADYVRQITGTDFAARFRDTCLSEAHAHDHIAAAGGEVALMDETGFEKTLLPVRGDIMLLAMHTPIPAICTGPGAAMRLVRGVVEVDLKLIKIIQAWKVPQCHVSAP